MAKILREKNINQILYIAIGSVLAILILFIVLFSIFNNNEKAENAQIGVQDNSNIQSAEQVSSAVGNTVEEAKEDELAENINAGLGNEGENVNQEITIEKAEIENGGNVNNGNGVSNGSDTFENNMADKVTDLDKEENIQEENPDPVFVRPVEGEIVKSYGKEKLIYSDTLKEWTTHLGIDIKADKTTVVKSSSDGVVKSIKNDPRYGLTIIIEHENGYSSIYSNLLSSEFITVGEKVKSGQAIGTVGNSASFEIVDEPHLHFEITKDGENIDPEMYIK